MDEDAGYTYGQNLITSYQNYDPFGGDMPAREAITLGDPTAAIGGMGPPIVGGPGSSYETGEGLPGEEAAAGSQGGSGGTGNILPSGIANALKKLFVDEAGKINTGSLLGIGALLSMLNRGSGTPAPSGYQGTVPRFTAVRQRVPIPVDETRRPGSGGRRYFSDTTFVPKAATGGLMELAQGRYLGGPTDGMADKLPANIDGKQEARLSHGEFVIPADVVSHLGNGNSDAGAQRLYDMMDRIRKARTGNSKQGKQINPDKYMPK